MIAQIIDSLVIFSNNSVAVLCPGMRRQACGFNLGSSLGF